MRYFIKKCDRQKKSGATQYKYKNAGWKSWGDWLGTGRIANQDKTFRSFERARQFVHKLKLKNITEWNAYCKSGNRQKDIPAHPERVYKDWKNWGDWLGNEK